MLAYTHQFLISLVFTIVVETSVIFFLLRKVFKSELGLGKIIFGGFFASFSTIPYVWYVFQILIYGSTHWAFIISELFAVLIELIFYMVFFNIGFKKSFIISLVANFLSAFLGFFIL